MRLRIDPLPGEQGFFTDCFGNHAVMAVAALRAFPSPAEGRGRTGRLFHSATHA